MTLHTKAPTELVLGWPPKELSPNARTHWRKKAPITKAYKAACWALALESGITAPDTAGRLHLWIDFYRPSRRQYDADNCLSSLKSGIDGLALALGVNDHIFVFHPMVMDDIGGFVRIKITIGPTQ